MFPEDGYDFPSIVEQQYASFRLNETLSMPSILKSPLPSIFNASLPSFFKNTKTPAAATINNTKSNDTNAFNKEFDEIHRLRDDELKDTAELKDSDENDVEHEQPEYTEKVTIDTDAGVIIDSRYYIENYIDDGYTGMIRRGKCKTDQSNFERKKIEGMKIDSFLYLIDPNCTHISIGAIQPLIW